MAGQRTERSNSQSEYSGNGESNRRNPDDDREQYAIGSEDTVYRYLCPARKIGSIIGRGGEIIKQLRAETQSKIRIGESIPGCEERVVTIYSSSEETNVFGESENFVSPAHDALFRVYDRIVVDESPGDDESEEAQQVIARLLVPSDQVGCIIGKGGQVIQNMRSETGAQIRILKNEHLPPCSLNTDELVQITGNASGVRHALYQVATHLHDNPSRFQHLVISSLSTGHQSGGGPHSLMGPYGGHRGGDIADGLHSLHLTRGDEAYTKEFSLRLVCPIGNIGSVIGKAGVIINQIRQETGAFIKVDSSGADGDDCIIFISTNEFYDGPSPTIDAAVRLVPRCSERAERDSGDSVVTTRLLVPSSQIGCLIGKGGAIISEMRHVTKASIRILSDDSLPRVAYEDDEMVQITGDLHVVRDALVQVTMRLKANVFQREGTLSGHLPAPHLSNAPNYGNHDNRSRRRGPPSNFPGYGSTDLAPSDAHGTYNDSQSGEESGHGAYAAGSTAPSGSAGLSAQNPVSYGKHHGY